MTGVVGRVTVKKRQVKREEEKRGEKGIARREEREKERQKGWDKKRYMQDGGRYD